MDHNLRPRTTRPKMIPAKHRKVSKNKLKDIKSIVCSKTSFIKKDHLDVHDEKQDDPGEIMLINQSDYLVEKVNVVKESENSHENNSNSKNIENSTVHQSVSNCKKIQIQNNFVKKNIENHIHTQTVHEEKKLFQCKIFKKLKRHIASVHEGKKPFNFSVCGSSLLKSGGPEDTCCKNVKGNKRSSVTFAIFGRNCSLYWRFLVLWNHCGKKSSPKSYSQKREQQRKSFRL